MKSTWFLVWSL